MPGGGGDGATAQSKANTKPAFVKPAKVSSSLSYSTQESCRANLLWLASGLFVKMLFACPDQRQVARMKMHYLRSSAYAEIII